MGCQMIRKIWMISFMALLLSVLLVYADFATDSTLQNVESDFVLSDGSQVIDPAFPFHQTGSLKQLSQWSLSTSLPKTKGDSLGFVTIGSRVTVLVDQVPIYRFGDDLNGKDIWGVKTHLVSVPDGPDGRKVTLFFETNEPLNIGASDFLYLGQSLTILDGLLTENLILMVFPLLYVAIGFFLLIVAFQSAIFSHWNLRVFLLALLSFSVGIRILLNISIVAYYTGPVAVFWWIQVSNFIIPLVVVLLFSLEKDLAGRHLLWVLAGFHGLVLAVWIISNQRIPTTDFRLLYWNNYLFLLTAAVIIGILVKEFVDGRKHLEMAASMGSIITAVFFNAYTYYHFGVQNTMDYSLIILTFPILVLLSGRTIYDGIYKEQQILMENTALKTQGDLLVQNYHRIEYYIEETKKIWHDIDKHTSIIHTLAEDGEYEELKKYLHSIGYQARRVKDSYLTGNKLVNAIFTDKMEVAFSLGIEWSATLDIPDDLLIGTNDLCSLLINLLDNAMEASCHVPEGEPRLIRTKLQMRNEFLYVGIENSFSKNPETGSPLNNLSLLRKGKAHHGYGLKIIQSIADRYDGLYETSQTDHIYSVQVALKNRPYEFI